MRILVTGSTGFVGRNLIPKLLENGNEILEITRDIQKSENFFGNKTKKYQITDSQEDLTESICVFKPEVVIHLAAYLTANDDYYSLQKLLESNIMFVCKLLDALKSTNLKLFVNTGTFAEYYKGDGVFDPAYIYAATKTASRSFLDYYSKAYNFKQVTVVPFTIYGGQDTQKKIVDVIYESISSSTPIDLSPGEQILDFIHIDDVVDFYIALINNIEKLPNKSNFQLGTGVGHTLKQLAVIIENITNQKTNINWGGKQYRPSDVLYAVADITLQNELINWQSKTELAKGIKEFVKIKSSLC